MWTEPTSAHASRSTPSGKRPLSPVNSCLHGASGDSLRVCPIAMHVTCCYSSDSMQMTSEQIHEQCFFILQHLVRASDMLSVIESKSNNVMSSTTTRMLRTTKTEFSSTITQMLKTMDHIQKVSTEVSQGPTKSVLSKQDEPKKINPQSNKHYCQPGKWEFNGSTTGSAWIVQ